VAGATATSGSPRSRVGAPVLEAALGRATEREPGVEVHRGQSVIGLTAAERVPGGIPHVTGVVTGDGRCRSADLVVDAGGRRSRLPDLLTTIGARRPAEELADLGYTYYGRHYRSADGSIPPMLGPPLQAYDSVSWATLPADNGTWSVVLVTVAGDGAVRAARHVEHWERIARSYPLIAHWLDAEPITGIDLMAGIDNRVAGTSSTGRSSPRAWWPSGTRSSARTRRLVAARRSPPCTRWACAMRCARWAWMHRGS